MGILTPLFDMVSGLFLSIMMTRYRSIFVVLVVLPASTLYDLWYYVRAKYNFKSKRAAVSHDAKVADVQQQVRAWAANPRDTLMCTGRPNWKTTSFRESVYKQGDTHTKIYMDLADVLEVDEERRIIRVEPRVTCGQLTHTLNPLGWTVPVLPELDDLTVGGLIMGFGIESSSHRYGLFQHVCVAYELVMSDGSLVRCTKDEHPELFYNVPWSYGTLGFLVAAEIRIIPIKKYVRLQYVPFYTRAEWIRFMEQAIADDVAEFIEVLAYDEQRGVVMLGDFTDDVSGGTFNAMGRFYKPWFFKHVETFLDSGDQCVEIIPIRDYYHRHTRSLFWAMRDICPFGNNPLFRYTLGWILPPKVSFMKLTQTAATKKVYEEKQVFQDMLVPLQDLDECVDVFHQHWRIYPLWICPMRLFRTPVRGIVNPPDRAESTVYVDVGAYGPPPPEVDFQPEPGHRAVEQWVESVHGFQTLYADTYQSQEDFERMYDLTKYRQLRQEWNCENAFPEIYGKVGRHARK